MVQMEGKKKFALRDQKKYMRGKERLKKRVEIEER